MMPTSEELSKISSLCAEEAIVVDFQVLLNECLRKRKMKRKDLAQNLNCSEGYVSQLFNDDANPSIKTLARVFHAAGYSLVLKPQKIK